MLVESWLKFVFSRLECDLHHLVRGVYDSNDKLPIGIEVWLI